MNMTTKEEPTTNEVNDITEYPPRMMKYLPTPNNEKFVFHNTRLKHLSNLVISFHPIHNLTFLFQFIQYFLVLQSKNKN